MCCLRGWRLGIQDQGVSRAMLLLKSQGKDLFQLLSQLLVVLWPVTDYLQCAHGVPLCVCVCVQIPLFHKGTNHTGLGIYPTPGNMVAR